MALRKLQAEIDRTLKAVTQGVEIFEETFEKLEQATNMTVKEKLESELKSQIKKLQRMRDQVKVWLGNSDIKDKSALLSSRKLIETQMERFKAVEKAMKMKAFSKEGLIAAARLDPAEKARRDMVDWIANTIEELSRQIEQTEAEAEQLQATGRKKKSAGDRLTELEQLNERRQWHISRLEIVQRMFENGQISLEQVESIQEDVKYFVEANTEEDFDYDTGIYDELNLQEVEDEYQGDFAQHAEDSSTLDSASIADLQESRTPSKEDKKSKSSSHGDDAPPSPVQSKRGKKSKEDKAEAKAAAKAAEAAAAAAAAAAAVAAAATPAPVAPAKPAPLPPIRYAAAAAAAVGSAPHPATGSTSSETASPVASKREASPAPEDDLQLHEQSAPELPAHTEEQPPASSGIPEVSSQTNGHSPAPPPVISASPSPSPQESSSRGVNGGLDLHQQSQQQSQQQQQHQLQSQQQQQQPQLYAHAESSRAAAGYSSSPRKEGVLENLMQSFGVAKDMAERRANDPNELASALDVSYHNAPSQLDAEPPRYYHPTNPIQTPSYYPQTRLPLLEDKNIYQRLELDQLFYIFYYMTGTYEQWLAAQELKRQSWRFHKQYLTWFQRAHNPQAITEDYEQGGYYYFDWENSWCQRRKSDFRFEYRWLSDH